MAHRPSRYPSSSLSSRQDVIPIKANRFTDFRANPFKRKRSNNPRKDVSNYGERVTVNDDDVTNDESDAPYEVVFVHNTAATTRCGCKGRVREKPSAPLPSAPYDIFIRHKERRIYNRAGETTIRISSKPEMVYYHPYGSCTGLHNDDMKEGKLVIPNEVRCLLTKVH